MVVYKYKLQLAPYSIINLPKGAKILKVDEQREGVFIWAMVDPLAEPEPREIEVFGTGHEMPPFERVYINTFFSKGGVFVFHVFERVKQGPPMLP